MDKKLTASPQMMSNFVDELKRVSWPTKQETLRLTVVVIVISLIIGLYIGIIDILLTKGLEFFARK